MKRFCLHCGQLYDGERCKCRKVEKREYKTRNNFYDTNSWKSVSRFVRMRDYNLDRLQLYFSKYEPDNAVEKRIHDYVMDVNNEPRKFDGRLVVHHIKELETNWQLRLNERNLISLNFHVHEYVHQLYFDFKETVQELLYKAVNAELP